MFSYTYANSLQAVCTMASSYAVRTALYGMFSCTYANSLQAVYTMTSSYAVHTALYGIFHALMQTVYRLYVIVFLVMNIDVRNM